MSHHQGTLCWAHTLGLILDEPVCPLVPQLPALPDGWHCCPVVADLARRVTLGREPRPLTPVKAWIGCSAGIC